MNYRQFYAIKRENEKRILKVNPNVPQTSGIYILTREEAGFKYAYVGQAKNLLERLASHLRGYQHIDLSLKKHGFFSEEKPCGYKILIAETCEPAQLDTLEQEYTLKYANMGYQLRNKTAGGQGEGKTQIAEYKPAKGYCDGLKQGYKNAQRDVRQMAKWLTVGADHRKLSQRALAKFGEFIKEQANE